ncbi:GtrA family protein [candidate division WWE3 bacterium]|nr:GtrA family protein [candidate division WWE3 bacterium]
MRSFWGEIVRDLIAGVANSVAGYGTFWVLLHQIRWNPWLANAGSYALGLMVAYLLNLRFVFRDSSHSAGAFLRFFLGFASSYALNLAVMQITLNEIKLRPEYSQLFAMASYTISFYLFNKFIVWTAGCGK